MRVTITAPPEQAPERRSLNVTARTAPHPPTADSSPPRRLHTVKPTPVQGLGPDGAEFVLAFDDGAQSESNTLLLTDWFAHTPPEVLAKNFRVAQEVFDDIPLHNLDLPR